MCTKSTTRERGRSQYAWGGLTGEQKGARREVHQEEYCKLGVISLPPICRQVDRPVHLPCLPLPQPSPSPATSLFLPSYYLLHNSNCPWCSAAILPCLPMLPIRMQEPLMRGMVGNVCVHLSSIRYPIPSWHVCLLAPYPPPVSVGLRPIARIMSRPENGVAPAHLLPLLRILPLHDVW